MHKSVLHLRQRGTVRTMKLNYYCTIINVRYKSCTRLLCSEHLKLMKRNVHLPARIGDRRGSGDCAVFGHLRIAF